VYYVLTGIIVFMYHQKYRLGKQPVRDANMVGECKESKLYETSGSLLFVVGL
jgi:hypothetical protein